MKTTLTRRIAGLIVLAMLATAAIPALGTHNSGMNDVSDWCEDGEKSNVNASTFEVPEPPEGYVWTKLVLKAGSAPQSVDHENIVIDNPVVGESYSWEGTLKGDPLQKEVSHAILCKEPVPTDPGPSQVKFEKIWEGDYEDLEGLSVIVHYEIDGVPGSIEFSSQYSDYIDIPDGSTLSFVSEEVVGVPDECSWEQTDLTYKTYRDGARGLYEITNDVDCDPAPEEVSYSVTGECIVGDEAEYSIDYDLDAGLTLNVADVQRSGSGSISVGGAGDYPYTITVADGYELEEGLSEEGSVTIDECDDTSTTSTSTTTTTTTTTTTPTTEPPGEDFEVSLVLTKTWSGDDEGDATVEFFVDGEGPYDPSEMIDVTDRQGETVTITEELAEDLPEDCRYSSTAPHDEPIPVAEDEDVVVEVDITNEVTCEEVMGETTSSTEGEPEAEEETTSTTEDDETEDTLPFTGIGTDGIALAALIALASGAGLILLTRRSAESEIDG